MLLVVVALALEAAACLMGSVRRRAPALFSLALSVVALALGAFEGVDSAGRVVGLDAAPRPVELGGNAFVAHAIDPPAHWDVGFYLFIAAALIAVFTSAIIVVATCRIQARPETAIAATLPAASGRRA